MLDLVLAESHLGRFEGVELIPELRTSPGVEEIPVVIVDGELRPERREAARRAGAAGYLVLPPARVAAEFGGEAGDSIHRTAVYVIRSHGGVGGRGREVFSYPDWAA